MCAVNARSLVRWLVGSLVRYSDWIFQLDTSGWFSCLPLAVLFQYAIEFCVVKSENISYSSRLSCDILKVLRKQISKINQASKAKYIQQ